MGLWCANHKGSWDKEQDDLEQRNVGRRGGRGEVGGLPKAVLETHLPPAQGSIGANPFPSNSTQWLEGKPDLNAFAKTAGAALGAFPAPQKRRHRLKGQQARTRRAPGATRGPCPCQHHLLCTSPSNSANLLAFFHRSSFPCQKRSRQWCPREVSHTCKSTAAPRRSCQGEHSKWATTASFARDEGHAWLGHCPPFAEAEPHVNSVQVPESI